MPLGARVMLLVAASVFAAGEAAAQCRVHASGLSFGIYRGREAAISTGTITVTCTAGTGFEIALSHGDGNYMRRVIRGDRNGTLTYNLYTSANLSRVWGDGITPGTHTVRGVGQGRPVVFHVYGRIDPGQKPIPGTYSTALTVTVTY